MIKVENIETWGWNGAIRGMRNPKNSWNRSDSEWIIDPDDYTATMSIGPNDRKLMESLTSAGTDHRKFLRMLHIQMDITAPLYWWKDFDTYRIGRTDGLDTVNGCSTMHMLHTEPITINMFSCEDLDKIGLNLLEADINYMEYNRQKFNETKDYKYWRRIIQSLGTNFNQKRTVDMTYETALRITYSRDLHKLIEFREFCKTILSEVPYLAVFYEVLKAKTNKMEGK